LNADIPLRDVRGIDRLSKIWRLGREDRIRAKDERE
jgi:hypothetical protein